MPDQAAFGHAPNSNFWVEIIGATVGAFTKVSGLEAVTEVLETPFVVLNSPVLKATTQSTKAPAPVEASSGERHAVSCQVAL